MLDVEPEVDNEEVESEYMEDDDNDTPGVFPMSTRELVSWKWVNSGTVDAEGREVSYVPGIDDAFPCSLSVAA